MCKVHKIEILLICNMNYEYLILMFLIINKFIINAQHVMYCYFYERLQVG